MEWICLESILDPTSATESHLYSQNPKQSLLSCLPTTRTILRAPPKRPQVSIHLTGWPSLQSKLALISSKRVFLQGKDTDQSRRLPRLSKLTVFFWHQLHTSELNSKSFVLKCSTPWIYSHFEDVVHELTFLSMVSPTLYMSCRIKRTNAYTHTVGNRDSHERKQQKGGRVKYWTSPCSPGTCQTGVVAYNFVLNLFRLWPNYTHTMRFISTF